MNINSKSDITMKNANESAKLQQSIKNSRAHSNKTDETEASSAGQETQRVSAGLISDTLDLSGNPEIESKAMEGTGKIDSVDTAEEMLEAVKQSILGNPEEAMSTQANSLPQRAIELIQ